MAKSKTKETETVTTVANVAALDPMAILLEDQKSARLEALATYRAGVEEVARMKRLTPATSRNLAGAMHTLDIKAEHFQADAKALVELIDRDAESYTPEVAQKQANEHYAAASAARDRAEYHRKEMLAAEAERKTAQSLGQAALVRLSQIEQIRASHPRIFAEPEVALGKLHFVFDDLSMSRWIIH